jgi:DNA-binding IclR family transcriptional regulator
MKVGSRDYYSNRAAFDFHRTRLFRIVNKMKTAQPTLSDGTQSVRRTISLLRILSTHTATGWRLSDLAEEAGLDHTTVHRMLSCLVQERFVTRVADSRRYTLGALAFELGLAAAPYFSIDQLAAPALAKLAGDTRDIVFLNVRSGFESVCVARYEGRSALKAYTVDVGTRRPLSLSAGGAAMLICMPRAEQNEIESRNLQSIIRRGQAKQIAVRRMLQRSRRLGYGLNLEDIIPGIAAVGVAIRSSTGEPVASLSLAATGKELEEPRRTMLLERLRSEVARLELALGGLRY